MLGPRTVRKLLWRSECQKRQSSETVSLDTACTLVGHFGNLIEIQLARMQTNLSITVINVGNADIGDYSKVALGILLVAIPIQMAAIGYAEMFMAWQGLLVLYGLPGLARMSSFQFEVIRETLIQFHPLFVEDPWNYAPSLLAAVQLLTIWECMTFKAQMDGEDQITEFDVWCEADDIMPVPKNSFKQEMETWSKRKVEHVWSMVNAAKCAVSSLLNESVHSTATNCIKTLQEVESLLDIITAALQEETAVVSDENHAN